MDYVEGTDAAQLVRNRYPHGMPPKDALEIATAIAEALDYAHESLLLHRDVKPANILLTDSKAGKRRILLADFGIAKAANETHGITVTNMTVGSVAYAAPEQLTGKKLDGRADQYALACTTFHLLTGQQPFINSNPAVVIGSHLSSPPPRLGAVRADLSSMDSVLAKGMAKEPHQRFDTCREFASALSGDTVWSSSVAETQLAPASYQPVPHRSGAEPPPSRTDATAISRRSAGRNDRHRYRRSVGGIHRCVRRRTSGAIAARAGSNRQLPAAATHPWSRKCRLSRGAQLRRRR